MPVFFLGTKSYCYSYRHKGKQHQTVKCKGFSLYGNNYVTTETIKNMVLNREKGVTSTTAVPQFNIRIEKNSRKLYNAYTVKKLSSDILSKRVLIENRAETLPFGYTAEMLEDPFFYNKT